MSNDTHAQILHTNKGLRQGTEGFACNVYSHDCAGQAIGRMLHIFYPALMCNGFDKISVLISISETLDNSLVVAIPVSKPWYRQQANFISGEA